MPRRRLHGRRGLKLPTDAGFDVGARRRLHGRRGLKSFCVNPYITAYISPPSRAAWIEIYTLLPAASPFGVAAFTGGVD